MAIKGISKSYVKLLEAGDISGGNATVPASAGDVAFVGSIADFTASFAAQQTTIFDNPENNPRWSRGLRLTDEAVYCGNPNADNVVAMLRATWLAIAAAVEPTLTWTPPYVTVQPVSASVTADGSTSVTFSMQVGTEMAATFGWEYNNGSGWAALGTAGTDDTYTVGGQDYVVAGSDGADAGDITGTLKCTVTITTAECLLTGTGSAPSDGDQVTLGSTTYTWKTSLTDPAAAGEVLIGAGSDSWLQNLVGAVNHTGTPGTDYSSLFTAASTEFAADAANTTAHTVRFVPIVAGTLTTTVPVGSEVAFGATTVLSITGFQYRCTATDASSGAVTSVAATLTEV